MLRAGTHGNGHSVLVRALQNREPFTTSGALKAQHNAPYNTGMLRYEDYEQFLKDRENIVYTVISYSTPIAWVTKNDDVYIVNQKFSATTSRHQSVVASYLR